MQKFSPCKYMGIYNLTQELPLKLVTGYICRCIYSSIFLSRVINLVPTDPSPQLKFVIFLYMVQSSSSLPSLWWMGLKLGYCVFSFLLMDLKLGCCLFASISSCSSRLKWAFLDLLLSCTRIPQHCMDQDLHDDKLRILCSQQPSEDVKLEIILHMRNSLVSSDMWIFSFPRWYGSKSCQTKLFF